ncbi:MAG: PIN domain-containing protein [Actinomycetota bacterium]
MIRATLIVWQACLSPSTIGSFARPAFGPSSKARPWVISTQVLAEFYWVATRRLTPPLGEGQAARTSRWLSALAVVASDRDLVLDTIDTAERHRLALWDALIVEAAVRGGCKRLLTEDLQQGSELRGPADREPFPLTALTSSTSTIDPRVHPSLEHHRAAEHVRCLFGHRGRGGRSCRHRPVGAAPAHG